MLQRLHATNRLGQWESEAGVKSVHWGEKQVKKYTDKREYFHLWRDGGMKRRLVLRVKWPLLHLDSQQKPPRDKQRTYVYLRKPGPLRKPLHSHGHEQTHTNQHILPTPSIASQHWHKANTVPIHLVVWWLTHSHMTMHWFLFFLPPLSPGSAGRIDGAVWRNPLSRHFSFPLTDRPWRARAFGPPAWLAARQLNKPSSCYNSLKHFQLPESNKSSRRALGCFSTSNPTPEQVLLRLSFRFICRLLRWRGRDIFFFFFGQKKAGSQWGKLGGTNCRVPPKREMILRFSHGVSKLHSAVPFVCRLRLHHPPT